jgi:predicted unusual protein kinase regulating ubiquinone biosynthesis (AarF/ABC1/UbiB family)
MASKKKKKNDSILSLKEIPEGIFSRGLSLAKLSFSTGAKAASMAVTGMFSDEERKQEKWKEFLVDQMEVLAQELGELKGTFMKAGQMLSVYGEYFLPAEANEFLKTLQSDSPPLEWPAIYKALKTRMAPENLERLEVSKEPFATASIGQVHRATIKETGEEICLKIQYPGVDKAIDGDLKAIRRIFNMIKIIPGQAQTEELFKEVRQMLHQEVDYHKELDFTEEYRRRLGEDARYAIPKTYPEFSSKKILATEFMDGVRVDSPQVKALSQERRNALGRSVLELFLREVFEWGFVQTDPHFGNYRVQIGNGADIPDRLVLLDFGAIRKIDSKFTDAYGKMVYGATIQDQELLIRGARELGLLEPGDSEKLVKLFADVCFLITEPYRPTDALPWFDGEGRYDYGKSDLPNRVSKKGAEMLFSFRLRPPPREFVFLDRKLTGVYAFQTVLGVIEQHSGAVDRYLKPKVVRE